MGIRLPGKRNWTDFSFTQASSSPLVRGAANPRALVRPVTRERAVVLAATRVARRADYGNILFLGFFYGLAKRFHVLAVCGPVFYRPAHRYDAHLAVNRPYHCLLVI